MGGRNSDPYGYWKPECERLKNEVRLLTQKLEHSQLQVSRLTRECDILRRELLEAEFGNLSGVATSPIACLPNEILQYIFSLATRFDGLRFPRVDPTAARRWAISATTRRAIPLVCHKWNMIGFEFVYEHIALESSTQMVLLMDVLNNLNPVACAQRVKWIRGIEFLMRDNLQEAIEIKRLSSGLISLLPNGRLQKFGIECEGCNGGRTDIAGVITVQALLKCKGRMEILHLPCIGYADGPPPEAIHHAKEMLAVNPVQPNILSLTGGHWEGCVRIPCPHTGPKAQGLVLLSVLRTSETTIHTLNIDCIDFLRDYGENNSPLVEYAGCVDTVNTVIGLNLKHFGDLLNGLLKSFPSTKRLSITLSRSYYHLEPSEVDHTPYPSLEEVIVYGHMTKWNTEMPIRAARPLFLKLDRGELPALQRIIIHGDFSEGCLDAARLLSVVEVQEWQEAFRVCIDHKVRMITHEGYDIHIWHDKHGIKLGVDGQSETSNTDDDEWVEENYSSNYCGSESDERRSDEEEDISDEEDSRYRYVSVKDIEPVESSDEEEDDE